MPGPSEESSAPPAISGGGDSTSALPSHRSPLSPSVPDPNPLPLPSSPPALAVLLRFLKSKLHHNPHFTLYDFHILNWASKLDSFRHEHSTFLIASKPLSFSSCPRAPALALTVSPLARGLSLSSDSRLDPSAEPRG
ncbi:hypothetical protein SAY87_008056 [Trapa incisa]|uniref:Uncharacterized protein n=1 Tax=Trapa incisa TaxID=236973 RepID=A0AAN7QFZ1_9MYRT|nr:hypothetical protein SAY87_008056 [Trapa incisa]